MDSIDISDLPEPFAEAVKAVAETFRRQLAVKGDELGEGPKKPPVELPLWPLGVIDGAVIGNLSREEIYDDRA